MADWAGPGPHTCRECIRWQGGNRYSVGTLKPARCQKAEQMLGAGLPAVPHYAPACKYFEINPKPPLLDRFRGV